MRGRKIRIAVLVERKHKLFPVSPDYVGISLSTTFQEHIKVILSEEGERRDLSELIFLTIINDVIFALNHQCHDIG